MASISARPARAMPHTASHLLRIFEDAMPQDLTIFEDAIQRVVDVVMFENWLRFYFIEEHGDALRISLPEKSLEQLKTRYADYYDLADRLNNRDVDHQTSMSEVCLFITNDFSARRLPEDLAARVFDSPRFMLEMQLFGSWVQSHEEQLDQGFLEFNSWLERFREWRKSDEVREYSKKLAAQTPTMASHCPETTQ
jgi:hypothetical protein